MVLWYCSSDWAQKSRYALPASVIEYIRRAGPPLEVSQVDSTMPSFSICRSVRYNVPGFIASNPNAAARSMSSYPYEFHSRKESKITGTSQFLGRASTPRNSVSPASASALRSSLSMARSPISMCILHICTALSRLQSEYFSNCNALRVGAQGVVGRDRRAVLRCSARVCEGVAVAAYMRRVHSLRRISLANKLALQEVRREGQREGRRRWALCRRLWRSLRGRAAVWGPP